MRKSPKSLTREIARQINYLNRKHARNDGWSNALTGLGTSSRDKRMSTVYERSDSLQEEELIAIYESEGIGHRVISLLAEDMNRKGFVVNGDTDNQLRKELKKIKGMPRIEEATRWALLHGGSVGVMGINDGGLYEEPVQEDRIEEVTHIHVFDRWRAIWTTADLYVDPESPKFATPEFYTIFPINPATVGATQQFNMRRGPADAGERPITIAGTKGKLAPAIGAFRVHESRVMRFDGIITPLKTRIRNRYWNLSYLQPIYERIKGLGESFANLELIISDFIEGVMSVEGLAAMLAAGNSKVLQDRLDLLDKTSHVLNTKVIDKEEVYERHTSTTTGLGELMDRLMLGISSATGIPEIILFGKSVGGLGSNDETNLRRYYDHIASLQKHIMEEPIEKLIKYIGLSRKSKFKLTDEDFEVEFKSLWALSEKDEAEVKKTVAETDQTYINSGVVTPEEVTKSRFGGDSYSYETVLSDKRDDEGYMPVPKEEQQELDLQNGKQLKVNGEDDGE